MSFRTLNQTTRTNSNPAVKFLEWKSNDKYFSYYDKDQGQNIKLELPLKIQLLEEFHTVKGWNDASESGIYANEVKFISKEPLKVKSFKGGDIAEGIYSDIRLKIIDAGGKYHKSIYALLNGEIVNISLKGSAVGEWSLFSQGDRAKNIQGNSGKFESHFIEINGAKDMKKGATKYSVPVFECTIPYTKSDLENAMNAYKLIADYYNKYTAPKEETPAEDEFEDDLAF